MDFWLPDYVSLRLDVADSSRGHHNFSEEYLSSSRYCRKGTQETSVECDYISDPKVSNVIECDYTSIPNLCN